MRHMGERAEVKGVSKCCLVSFYFFLEIVSILTLKMCLIGVLCMRDQESSPTVPYGACVCM